jgi:small subunit ribosomal protein S5
LDKIDPNAQELKDQVVSINRVTKVVKGGKNLSFSALVVVGDQNGLVGYGMGKAKEVPQAIRKGVEQARKKYDPCASERPHDSSCHPGPVWCGSYPKARLGRHGRYRRRTGSPSSVCRHFHISRSRGSTNHNVVKATFDGLKRLREPNQVAKLRGKQAEEL